MRQILTIGLIILTQGIFAQSNPELLLDKVTNYYQGLENMELKIDYLIFNNHNSQKVSERAFGHYIKNGESHYMKQYGTTMILVDNELLIKDDSTQMIVLSKTREKDAANMNQLTNSLTSYYQVKELKENNGNKCLALIMDPNKPSDIHRIELEIDEETLQIKTMMLYYRKQYDISNDPRKPILKQPRMKLVYTYFNADPTIKKDQFKFNKYVKTDQSGNKKLTAQYNSYEFIYQ